MGEEQSRSFVQFVVKAFPQIHQTKNPYPAASARPPDETARRGTASCAGGGPRYCRRWRSNSPPLNSVVWNLGEAGRGSTPTLPPPFSKTENGGGTFPKSATSDVIPSQVRSSVIALPLLERKLSSLQRAHTKHLVLFQRLNFRLRHGYDRYRIPKRIEYFQ